MFKVRKNKSKLFFAFLIVFVFFGGILAVSKIPALASATDGTINATDKYAWTENAGWLNFGTTEGNVHVTDSVLTGYAWSENLGWISLNCSNTSSCGTVDYKISNNGEGTLTGYAWSENAGWINFNPTYGGVTINSSGEFLGYAWGENIGWIVLNCNTTASCATVSYKVKTDWRPASTRISCGDGTCNGTETCGTCAADCGSCSSGGGSSSLPSDAKNPPIPPIGGFKVFINGDQSETNSREVVLSISGGPNTVRMAISNTPDFKNANQENYQITKNWILSEGEGSKMVYVKFYTKYGQPASGIFSDGIVYKKSAQLITQPSFQPVVVPTFGVTKNSSPTVKPSAAKPVFLFTKNLILGSRGMEVTKLQEKLQSFGFFPKNIKPTGLYGPTTLKAVKAFQKANKVETLGIVGPKTRVKLNER
jgi:hypothetical protein